MLIQSPFCNLPFHDRCSFSHAHLHFTTCPSILSLAPPLSIAVTPYPAFLSPLISSLISSSNPLSHAVLQTVELYYPNADYDFETMGQLTFSFVSTVLMVVLVYWSCNPESKIFLNAEKFILKNRRSKHQD